MMCIIVFITCASIHACRRSGRHLIAFDRDLAIFDEILAFLCDLLPPPIVQWINMAYEDDDEPIRKVPRNFVWVCKFVGWMILKFWFFLSTIWSSTNWFSHFWIFCVAKWRKHNLGVCWVWGDTISKRHYTSKAK